MKDVLIHCWVFEVFGGRHGGVGVGVVMEMAVEEMRLKMESKSRWKKEEGQEVGGGREGRGGGGGRGCEVEYMWRMMHLVGRCRASRRLLLTKRDTMAGK